MPSYILDAIHIFYFKMTFLLFYDYLSIANIRN